MAATAFLSCHPTSTGTRATGFVRVADGILVRDGQPYRFLGTNMWYAPILASEGQGGDRARLAAELDTLSALGINNLRILVGADGDTPKPALVWPTLQTAPGVYNDTLLAGLDWLMCELGRRDMTAVLYLNNSWEWSGGYGQYLEWAGCGPAADPTRDGYEAYVRYAAQFAANVRAQQIYLDHVRYIVTRTNRYTNRPYAADPAIMAWQIGNEPRAFAADSATRVGFEGWIARAAALIHELDTVHLVSVGSEGTVGCAFDSLQYERIHADKNIDYLTAHVWPMNWGWLTRDQMRADTLGTDTAAMNRVCRLTDAYLDQHLRIAQRLCKPLVVEEFGYARDGLRFDLAASTRARDIYYRYVLSRLADPHPHLAGFNFWAWSGLAQPRHERWQFGDDYCGDPAQEEQGLFSVFVSDTSTIGVMREIISRGG